MLRVVLRSSPLSLNAPAMPPLVPALTVTALALNWLRLAMSLPALQRVRRGVEQHFVPRLQRRAQVGRQLRDLLAHQALLVEAVAQALLRRRRVQGQRLEQVVAGQPVAVVGETRVGLDPVARAGLGLRAEQAALAAPGPRPACRSERPRQAGGDAAPRFSAR
ncbi:hypothetical protein [Rubrivivax gelatinosus]|uniref:hypothetical protein n=1 Tax=Rubrivivax gelatinosus TaxID=28068 RepID=UPI001907D98E|nr:hypothetical protein [Rubrivivax gelatinosus]